MARICHKYNIKKEKNEYDYRLRNHGVDNHDFFCAEICGVCYKIGVYILFYHVSFLRLYIMKKLLFY